MQLYLFVIATVVGYVACYDPNWESLDSCPCPEWFDKSKPGIFVHWGMYSVPAYATEWISRYWADKHKDVLDFINRNFPGQSYGDLASKFSAADFTGKGSADIVKASGAKYFVVTSKHHDGYTLWPSTTSLNWNAVDIGAHRDLIQEFKEGITEAGIHFGLYFSQMDWFHHLYISDPHNKTTLYTDQVSLVQMRELIHNYEPDLLWSDGDWERPDTYWKATQFIAWLFNDSPVKDKIVVNDRWGAGIPGHHGSYITGTDKFMPGKLLKRKW
ncbi:unnamed protein product [Bursaphelenchus okinawaensis]|uniref:alpha-L-fucosidase n=1 Tax=Bursaphelenchus okinawaensis TaxID=465554 RepID=A0A811LMZ0_9BILA|nr:unnamed protein product [Bursaphelenchus okinawaensis]CAG9125786.1 unnamed protein product [Bursaphelenchus okinawaensis]